MTKVVNSELWVDGFGNHVEIHERTQDCLDHGCCIHNPSDHHMRSWPMLYRFDRGLMERVCPHGVGRPDPDAMAYGRRRFGADADSGVHGCDGCCASARPPLAAPKNSAESSAEELGGDIRRPSAGGS